VLPIIGNQWNTTGGSFGFLNRTWFKTFRTTDRARNTTKAAPSTRPRPRWATTSATVSLINSRTPMLLRDTGGRGGDVYEVEAKI
jgi:hypothetical protein